MFRSQEAMPVSAITSRATKIVTQSPLANTGNPRTRLKFSEKFTKRKLKIARINR